MKCSIPEISWHNREPVLSVDIQPQNPTNNDFYRLATGGSDTLVLIWKLKIGEEGQVDISVLSELTRHQRSVNVVKWSPNGEILASADDDANIILWELKTDNIPSLDERDDDFEEKWNALKVLRGHKEDVYDLCWSPKCDKLLSGSVDNTAILWDVAKGKTEHIISEHKGFVQGVAWDPKSQCVATLSSDRLCRVFQENGRKIKARIGRGMLPVQEGHEFYEKEVKYFHDDTFKTYFRRLTFTPDGNFLLVPSGAVETDERKNVLFGTFAFTIDSFNKPVCLLPSMKQCSIAVKCCPVLFELRKDGPQPFVDLPYRMIIAVATDSDVILYDTQQHAPCVHLQNIHYTRLTDLTWSPDGLLLSASSTDGFITFVTFEEGELGTVYVKEESDVEESLLNISGCEELPPDDVDVKVEAILDEKASVKKDEEKKTKKSSFIEQWTKGKRTKDSEDQECGDKKKMKIGSKIIDSSEENKVKETDKDVKNNVKKRITPILISKKDSSDNIEIKTEVKKRITPILISKEVTSTIKPETVIIPEVVSVIQPNEEKEEKTKKRIQPIKVGDITRVKTVRKTVENRIQNSTQNIKEAPLRSSAPLIETQKDTAVTVVENKPEVNFEETKPSEKKQVSTETKPAEKMQVSPKTTSTPADSKPKNEKSSSKKKKPVTPCNTLLNFFKPISSNKSITKTGKEEQEDKDACEKEFKPQNLFAAIKFDSRNVETEMTPVETKAKPEIKLKTSTLLKPKTKPEVEPKIIVEDTETLDDFVLQIEESNDVEMVDLTEDSRDGRDMGTNGEKENEQSAADSTGLEKTLKTVRSCDIDADLKQPRRIPLITLSSPKNKKKKSD